MWHNIVDIWNWMSLNPVIVGGASGLVGYVIALFGKHHADRMTIRWKDKRDWRKKRAIYESLKAQMKPAFVQFKRRIIRYPMLKDFSWIHPSSLFPSDPDNMPENDFFYLVFVPDVQSDKINTLLLSYGFIERLGENRFAMSDDLIALMKADESLGQPGK
jgi:hypothetical protein